MISAVVLTKNNQPGFDRCLKSLAFCDETVILTNDFLTDFSAQRNLGLKKAKGGWILFVDSDEVVSKNLKNEILKQVQNDSVNGFYLKRDDYFLGKWLKFGETGNIKLLHLARKDAGKWYGKVHEIWKVSGSIGELKNPLLHYSHPNIREFMKKINHYTDIASQEKKEFSYFQTFVYPPGKFFYNYFLRRGFLDGMAGFVMAYMMSLHSLIVRVKRYDLLQNL